MLTQERLKELLHYDPDTGIFRAKITTSNRKAGRIAGCHNQGYILIWVDGKRYKAHRLAWLYMTGRLPENYIDHINRDGCDNSWLNLRDVSHMENMSNKTPAKSELEHPWVYWDGRKGGRWYGSFVINGRRYYAGSARDRETASELVKAKRAEILDANPELRIVTF